MMRKFLMAAPLAAMLMLGGCGTTSNTADIIAQIQAATVAACEFLPTATTIANILAAGNPALTTGAAIANAICSAVTPKAGRLRGGAPTVAGVVIHGKFIR